MGVRVPESQFTFGRKRKRPEIENDFTFGDEKPKSALRPLHLDADHEKGLRGLDNIDTAFKSSGDLPFSLHSLRGIDPKLTLDVIELSKQTGMPIETVARNPAEIKDLKQAQELRDILLAKNANGELKFPAVAKFLMDPDNPGNRVSLEDHADAAAKLEAHMLSFNGPLWKRIPYNLVVEAQNVARSGLTTLTNISTSDWYRLYMQTQLDQGRALSEAFGDSTQPTDATEPIRPQFFGGTPEQEAMRARDEAELWDMIRTTKVLNWEPLTRTDGLDQIALDVTGVAPQIGGALIANAMLPFVGGPAFITSHIFGSTFEQLDEKGVEESRAIQAAMANAIIQTPLEFIGLRKIAGLWNIRGWKNVLKGYLSTLFTEGATEILQQVFGESPTTIFGEANLEGGMSNREMFDRWFESLPESIKQGAYEGMVVGIAAGAMGSRGVFSKSIQAEQHFRWWKKFVDAKDKLTQDIEGSPETITKLIGEIAEHHGVEDSVHISAEVIEKLFQDGNIASPNEVFERLGISPEQRQESLATGKDIPIEYRTYFEAVAGTDIGITLENDIRLAPDEPTLREMSGTLKEATAADKKFMADLVETINQEQRSLAQLPPNAKAIRDTLIKPKREGGFGLRTADADANLAVFLAGANRLSRFRGETLNDWLTRVDPILKIGGTAADRGVKQTGKRTPRAATFIVTTPEGRLQRIIQLFKGADKSSFAHESAHIFILDMQEAITSGIVTDPVLKAELQTSFDTLVEFGGGLNAQGQLSIAGQEKIARAFEQYLQTGKAPSIKLVEAFRRFRQWLTAIYGALRTQEVKVTEAIRDIFDSMLASELDIEEAARFYGVTDTILDLIPDVDVEKKEKAETALADAQESAIEKQVRRMYRAFLRIGEHKNEITKRATELVDSQSAYQLIQAVRDDKGISKAAAIARHGEKVVNEVNRKHGGGLITARGRGDVLDLASEFGVSPDELVNVMRITPRRSEAIKEQKRLIQEEIRNNLRRDIAAEGTLAGDDALHDDKTVTFLLAEAQLLAEKVASKKRQRFGQAQKKAFTTAAKDLLGRKTVKAASAYHAFARAEQRDANAAHAAAVKGDFDEALRLKDRQIFNHILVLEAIKVRKEMEKGERRYQKKVLTSSLKGIENDYREAILAIVNAFGLTKNTTYKLQHDTIKTFEALRNADPLLTDLIPAWIESRAKIGNAHTDKQTWRTELSVNEFREIDETIQSIRRGGADVLLALKEGKFTKRSELIEASILAMEKLKQRKVLSVQAGKNADQKTFLDKLDGALSQAHIMSFVLERADNYAQRKDDGSFGPMRTLHRLALNAEIKYNEIKSQIFKDTNASWKTIEGVRRRLTNERGKLFDIEGVPVTEAQQEAGRYQWSADQVIAVVLNMGTQSNLSALMSGYDYTLDQLNIVASLLTNTELDAIQNIWDVTDSLFEEYDTTFFDLYNRHLTKIPAQAVTLTRPDGSTKALKGGYYHLDYDPELNAFVERFKSNEDVDDFIHTRNKNNFTAYTPAQGATKERVEQPSLPPKLTTTVWMKHVNDVARYISHARIMSDMNAITLNEQWAAMFKSRFGRPMYKELRNWVSHQALPERRIPDGFFGRGLEGQRERATVAFLGLKLGVGMKQRLSISAAVSEVGVPALIRAAREMGARNVVYGAKGSHQWEKVLELSGYMRIRARAFDRDLKPALRSIRPPRGITIGNHTFTQQDVVDFAFEWIQMNDRAAVGIVWTAGFNRTMDQIGDDATLTNEQKTRRAIEAADALVESTQPSALPLDLSGLQRAEGAIRLFTLFQTWQTKAGNRYINNFRLWQDGAITGRDYWRRFLYEAVAAPWMGAFISALIYRWELPEWWELATSPFESAVGWIPIAREIPSAIRFGRDPSRTVVLEGVSRAKNTAESAIGVIKGKDEWDDLIWNLASLVEWQTKVPASSVIKEYRRAMRNFEEAKKK